MKRVFLFILALGSLLLVPYSALADETVTVTATSSDISENLDLKTVATLFGQAKDLEQFEQLLNNPDSAFSNLDLNGDGEVDYLRVIETADNNRHLVVIQAVLAKDIYQDVASIFVEKDANDQITVQVVGDEYIYGADYIIEPVYIYRPLIYDWFWGTSWVCWHSPYYWGYWPGWWRPYYCVDPFLYWDHCYWHHYHYPYCSFRMGHHHAHYHNMYDRVRRNDYAHRHPERSFATRNASRNVSNARAFEQSRRTAVRDANATRTTTSRGSATRVSTSSTTRGNAAQASRNATYGSTNVRGTTTTATRGNATRTSSTTTSRTSTATTRTTTTTRTTATPSRTTTTRSTITTTRTQPSRSSVSTSATPSRSSSSAVRSSSSSTMRSSAPSTVRSSSSSTMRSSGGMSGGGSRSGGSSSSRSGGSTRR